MLLGMFGVFYFINKWEVFVFVVGGNILFGVRKKKLESFRKVFKFNIKFFFFKYFRKFREFSILIEKYNIYLNEYDRV